MNAVHNTNDGSMVRKSRQGSGGRAEVCLGALLWVAGLLSVYVSPLLIMPNGFYRVPSMALSEAG